MDRLTEVKIIKRLEIQSLFEEDLSSNEVYDLGEGYMITMGGDIELMVKMMTLRDHMVYHNLTHGTVIDAYGKPHNLTLHQVETLHVKLRDVGMVKYDKRSVLFGDIYNATTEEELTNIVW